MSNENHSFSLSFGEFKIPYWLVSIFSVVVATGLYCAFGSTDPEHVLTFMGAFIGVSAAVFASIYAAKSYQAVCDQKDLDKMQKAYDIATRWNSAEMKEVRSEFKKAISETNKKGKDDLAEALKCHDLTLALIFGYFEDIALAIRHKLADEDVLYDQLNSAVVVNFEKFGDWITEKQKGQPTAYCQAEELAARWKIRRTRDKGST